MSARTGCTEVCKYIFDRHVGKPMGSVHEMAPVSFGDASVCMHTSGLATFAFTVRVKFIRNLAR